MTPPPKPLTIIRAHELQVLHRCLGDATAKVEGVRSQLCDNIVCTTIRKQPSNNETRIQKKPEKRYSSEATGSTRTTVPLRRLVDQGKTVLVIVFCPETNKSIKILEEAKIKKSIKRAYIYIYI